MVVCPLDTEYMGECGECCAWHSIEEGCRYLTSIEVIGGAMMSVAESLDNINQRLHEIAGNAKEA